jgi:hypothetical protein
MPSTDRRLSAKFAKKSPATPDHWANPLEKLACRAENIA